MEWLRGFRADYGIPVMVVVWTCISYIPWKRPLVSLNPWPPQNLAQQVDFNLRKPPSFHYDLLLLGFLTILCGLLGIPPSNGVIPQSPMHTRGLATLKHQLLRNKLVAAPQPSETMELLGDVYGSREEAYQQMLSSDTPRACSDSGSQTVTNAKGFSLQAWETQISVRYRDISQDYIASGKSQARKTYYSYHINLR
ncbi:hypothetical protein AALP_AA3G069800 [Arabis alpina]|uniref:Bicarbonate transporter-like transmembrane domain-containing protein n=1 Tax=Arabis alpina TaxID=50452 RepID=A0A087H7K1_ARAAL|nr:hypothetical protein AALP_AA3G069800 [Arabis alpina]